MLMSVRGHDEWPSALSFAKEFGLPALDQHHGQLTDDLDLADHPALIHKPHSEAQEAE
jgi:hypothetical protein